MTYGAHQEETARALNDLVLSADAFVVDTQTVLECRHHLLAAARERLTLLAGGPWDPSRSRAPTVMTVASRPLQALAGVLEAMPHTDAGHVAPSDLLPGPPAESSTAAAELWRCAARNMTLANHELSTAANQPWVSNNPALWNLAGDLAAVVEAIVVLDRRLIDQELLPRVSESAEISQRLVTGDVSRLARWFGTDHAADLSYASPLSKLGLYDGPRIHMVHRPEDLPAAQRTLAALIRYRRSDPRPRVGLRAARVISVGQIRLSTAFADWASRTNREDLVHDFGNRISAYKKLHRSTVRLVEVHPTRSPDILAQQSEMVTQLRRFQLYTLPGDVLTDLNDATHEVSSSLGRILRREGLHRKNLMVLEEHGLALPRPRAITNTREPFHVACKELADDPHPAVGAGERWVVAERERLRTTLDQEPAESPPSLRRVPDLTSPAVARYAPSARTIER